jgi:hypothetical protein
MRRLLLLPALALVLVGTPVLALQEPAPPGATVQDTPVVTDQKVDPGWQSAPAPVSSSLVGVTWQGDPSASFTVEARAADGTWSAAAPVDAADIGPDAGTPDAAAAATAAANTGADHATEPVWVGEGTTAVRVKVDDGTATNVSVAAVVDSPAAAPDGAAGALAGLVGPVEGSDRYVFAGALAVLVALLVALALGWHPTRALRGRKWLAVLGLGALVLTGCVPVTKGPPPPSGSTSGGSGSGGSGGGSAPAKPTIVSRSQWGARAFGCGTPDYASLVKFAVVHHTVNSNGYDPASVPSMLRGIQAYHMDTLGYCDIAYNFLVDSAGRIYEGRAGGTSKPVIGAHAGGFNTQSVGVALIGDFTAAQPSGAQFNALVSLLRWRLSDAGVDPSQPFSTRAQSSPCGCVRWADGTIVSFPTAILAHRDVDFTSCPGDAFFGRMDELRAAVYAGVPKKSALTAPKVTTTTPTTAPATTTTTKH